VEKQDNLNIRQRTLLEALFGSHATATQADIDELDGDGRTKVNEVSEGIFQFKSLVGAASAETLVAGVPPRGFES
jgi:hypothetical protein